MMHIFAIMVTILLLLNIEGVFSFTECRHSSALRSAQGFPRAGRLKATMGWQSHQPSRRRSRITTNRLVIMNPESYVMKKSNGFLLNIVQSASRGLQRLFASTTDGSMNDFDVQLQILSEFIMDMKVCVQMLLWRIVRQVRSLLLRASSDDTNTNMITPSAKLYFSDVDSDVIDGERLNELTRRLNDEDKVSQERARQYVLNRLNELSKLSKRAKMA